MKLELIKAGDLKSKGFTFHMGFLLPTINFRSRDTDFGKHRAVGVCAPTTIMFEESSNRLSITLQVLGFGVYWLLIGNDKRNRI